MPGRGPMPKDPSKRARRNKDPQHLRVVEVESIAQPELSDLYDPPVRADDKASCWPASTLRWWGMWGSSPLTDTFTDLDWDELGITAMCHARMCQGSSQAGTEYRLRVGKFGATPEDRARLRIAFATADKAEAKGQARKTSRERYSRPVAVAAAEG